MRTIFIALLLFCSSFCLAQTDTMFVAMMDGTIRVYSIPLISQITFAGVPTSVREQELMQSVLSSFALSQNYPNPFNPSTTVQYSIPKAGEVEARIIDIQGRLVRSLSKSYQVAGNHSLVWDSRGNSGTVVASGTYFCQVLFNGTALVKKLVLIK
ncbi:MAG: FlgD immunoglobulin-like domain containing protein [Bacteroidota bacterium]